MTIRYRPNLFATPSATRGGHPLGLAAQLALVAARCGVARSVCSLITTPLSELLSEIDTLPASLSSSAPLWWPSPIQPCCLQCSLPCCPSDCPAVQSTRCSLVVWVHAVPSTRLVEAFA